MQIMTENGWRPLFDAKTEWERKHFAIRVAEKAIAVAKALPGPSIGEDKNSPKHVGLNKASAQFQAACDNFRN